MAPPTAITAFYETPLGQWVREALGEKMAAFWPIRRGDVILGVGYPIPYMGFLKNASEKGPLLTFDPEHLAPWPSHGPNRVVLGCEDVLPFADERFDKLLVVHGVEQVADPSKLLREMWRILKPEGEVLMVIPRSYSPWVMRNTPWKKRGLLLSAFRHVLQQHFFTVLGHEKALFTPPFFVAKAGFLCPFFETLGMLRLWPFQGVWLVRAQKQVFQMASPGGGVCQPRLIFLKDRP